MKTVFIYSSARKHGNTGTIVLDRASELNAEVVYLDELTINTYDYEHSHRHDDFEALLTKIIEFDHVVIASPVYWYSVTATMKAFFDRTTDLMDIEELKPSLRQWRGKTFSILSTSNSEAAPVCFVEMIQSTMEYLGLVLFEKEHVYIQST
ncbi:FMN reductase, NADPH-dependent [Pseudoalteromonas luteoviolacea B = ATCC 29581]|nr:FMN reductase, NADPH-dependent [Pseudoalteromonas luteoviolacea B = ATCC 29581]